MNRPDLDPEELARTRELMNKAVRDCPVTGYAPLIDAIGLPDPDDRHVLAAAIKARAQVIVTSNLKDFPPEVLDAWDMEAKSPEGRKHRKPIGATSLMCQPSSLVLVRGV